MKNNRRLTYAMAEKIQRLTDRGESNHAIGTRLHKAPSTIWSIQKRYGMEDERARREREQTQWDRPRLRLLRTLWEDESLTVADVSRKLGLRESTYRWQVLRLEMGRKAFNRVHAKPKKPPPVVLEPEPRGIFFEDHPDTVRNRRTGARYVRGEK